MFLHSGASLHGHEYSSRSSSTLQASPNLRTPLLRSAFAPPKQRVRAVDGATPPVLRRRPASDYIPREPSPVVHFQEPLDDDGLPSSPSPPVHDDAVSDSELSDATLSLDSALVAEPTTRPRRRRRAQHISTTYCLGYPAPRIIPKTKVMEKVFLPRLLLQLQRISEDGRSQPVLEVFPASRIAGPVVPPRLAKRFPTIFGIKRHLGYDDLVLVRRDDHDVVGNGTESESDESLERRRLLAVYSPLKHSDEAEIVLDDGSVWVAKPLASGSYDFVYTDARGTTTTARWAKRRTPAVSPTCISTETSTLSAAGPQIRYTFSIINPLTRRHPVMATLTPSTLDVQDTFTLVSASHGRHPPIARPGRSLPMASSSALLAGNTPDSASRPASLGTGDLGSGSAIDALSTSDLEPSGRKTHQVDDATKMLISVTALWVALRSGWSQNYAPSKSSSSVGSSSHEIAALATAATLSTGRPNRGRRNTWTTRSQSPSLLECPGAAAESAVCGSPLRPGVRKRYSLPLQPYPQPSIDKDKDGPTDPDSSSHASTPLSTVLASHHHHHHNNNTPITTRPRRATSTGASFMQRHLQQSSLSSETAPLPPRPSSEMGRRTAGDYGGDIRTLGHSQTQQALPASVVPPQILPAAASTTTTATTATTDKETQSGFASACNTSVPREGLTLEKGRNASLKERASALWAAGERGREREGDGSGRSPAGVKRGGVRSRLARWVQKLV